MNDRRLRYKLTLFSLQILLIFGGLCLLGKSTHVQAQFREVVQPQNINLSGSGWQTFNAPALANHRAVGVNIIMNDAGADWDARPMFFAIRNGVTPFYLGTNLTNSCSGGPNAHQCASVECLEPLLCNQSVQVRNPCFDVCTGGAFETHEYIMSNYNTSNSNVAIQRLELYLSSGPNVGTGLHITQIRWYFVYAPPPGPVLPNVGITVTRDDCFAGPLVRASVAKQSNFDPNINYAQVSAFIPNTSTNYTYTYNPPPNAVSPAYISQFGNQWGYDAILNGWDFKYFLDSSAVAGNYNVSATARNTASGQRTAYLGPFLGGGQYFNQYLGASAVKTGTNTATFTATYFVHFPYIQQFRVTCTPAAGNCNSTTGIDLLPQIPVDPTQYLYKVKTAEANITGLAPGTTTFNVRLAWPGTPDQWGYTNQFPYCGPLNASATATTQSAAPTLGPVNGAANMCLGAVTTFTADYSHPSGYSHLRQLGFGLLTPTSSRYLFPFDGTTIPPASRVRGPFTATLIQPQNATTVRITYSVNTSSLPAATNNTYQFVTYAVDDDASSPDVGWTQKLSTRLIRETLAQFQQAVNLTLSLNNSNNDTVYESVSRGFTKSSTIGDPFNQINFHSLVCTPGGCTLAQLPGPTLSSSGNVASSITHSGSATYTVRSQYCSYSEAITQLTSPPVAASVPWLMTLGGDVHVQAGVNSLEVPISQNVDAPADVSSAQKFGFALNGNSFLTTYLFSKLSGSITKDIGTLTLNYKLSSPRVNTQIFPYNDQNVVRYFAPGTTYTSWLANSGFQDLLLQNGIQVIPLSTDATAVSALNQAGDTTIQFSGNLNIQSGTVCNGKKLLFIPGNLIINPPLTSSNTGGCLFVVGGNVSVNLGNTTGTTQAGIPYNEVDAMVISLGSFNSAPALSSNQLYWDGSVIYNTSGTLPRNSGQIATPSELIKYNPKYLRLFRDFLGSGYAYKVREANYTGN